jgi:hypothetical protein
MNEKCPHCGIALPIVHDPFCPDCRSPLDALRPTASPQPSAAGNGIQYRLSDAAKLVMKLHFAATLVGTGMVIIGIWEYGSPGRYPVVFLVIPVFLTAALSCGASMAVLRWWGVPTFVPAGEVLSETPDTNGPN